MAKSDHYNTQFVPEAIYHVYNRAINRQPLFHSAEHHRFFLQRYDRYLSPVVKTYSYALCKNHFHFAIQIKSTEVLEAVARQSKREFKDVHALVSSHFRRFFLSYAKAFNKEQNRVGALFQRPFKRCIVDSEAKLIRLLLYHHSNPQKHQLCSDFRTYTWTSYSRYLMDKPSKLPKTEVFELFGDKTAFIEAHRTLTHEMKAEAYFIE